MQQRVRKPLDRTPQRCRVSDAPPLSCESGGGGAGGGGRVGETREEGGGGGAEETREGGEEGGHGCCGLSEYVRGL